MKTKLHSMHEQIKIWNLNLTDLQTETDACRALLTEAEQARALTFFKPEDGTRFVLSRGLLRRILAGYLDIDPSQIVFERNENGKPFLNNSELEFNVSHSHNRLLIAVTAGRALGVDIEMRRDGVRMEAIAERWFAPQERKFFQSLENPATGFFDIWAKKEAYVKALGQGIFQELNSFSVPTGCPANVPEIGSDPKWFFQSLEIDPAYAAAVVSEAPPVSVLLQGYNNL